MSKHFKATKWIGRGNPNGHFDKSYDTERCPEVDHVEYLNRQSLINIIDAVQSLQSLMVKNYYLTIRRICLVINTPGDIFFHKNVNKKALCVKCECNDLEQLMLQDVLTGS